MWPLIATLVVGSAPCELSPFPRASAMRPVVLPENAIEVSQRIGLGTNLVTFQAVGITEVRGTPACALQLRATAFEVTVLAGVSFRFFGKPLATPSGSGTAR